MEQRSEGTREQEEGSRNALRIVGSFTLQHIGDRIVDPKTVLAWLLATLGAPAAATGLLVPVREAGSLLPQTTLVPVVRRFAIRKWVWVVGAVGQALAVLGMAVVALASAGTAAAGGILGCLAVFALARALSSIASKDVLGRTVPRGQRGRVIGFATVGAGLVAVTLGIVVRMFGGEDVQRWAFAAMLLGAAVSWLLAAAWFSRVVEEPGEVDPTAGLEAVGSALGVLRSDAVFRRFVLARTLLLVSALSPPFVVQLGATETGAGLGGLGWFLVAAGVASIFGGPLWGRLADRSSRRTMMVTAGAGAGVLVALLLARTVPALRTAVGLYPLAHLLLMLVHTGSRIGRKTYLVDLAEGDRRTSYVAVSNTAMGFLLLVFGGVSAAAAQIGLPVALGVLAGMGLLGVVVSATLPETSEPAHL